jgi:hypothetical protein
MGGQRPPKPQNAETVGFSETIWELMQQCWQPSAASRPDIGNAVLTLEEMEYWIESRLQLWEGETNRTACEWKEKMLVGLYNN